MLPLLGLVLGIVGTIYAIYLARWVLKQDPGTEKMKKISEAISVGARAYLFRQYRTIGLVLAVLTAVIGIGIGVLAAVSFLIGALGSMLAGYLGMYVTTRSASRAAQAARNGVGPALKVAWRAGAVMGLALSSIALLAISGLYIAYSNVTREWALPLVALGFGASLITLFMRVGGGIYTKAADLGADLVGKVEVGIPEDDPRNPGVIADNVGDNVGDVAGMSADVFESYIVTLTAAVFLAWIVGLPVEFVELPILYGALALLATFIGVAALRAGNVRDPMKSISMSINLTILLSVVLFIIASFAVVGKYGVFEALAMGVAASLGALLTPIILKITDYYTSFTYRPVVRIAEQAQISPATVIVTGYSIGLVSAIPTIGIISAVLGVTYYLGYVVLGDIAAAAYGTYGPLLAGIYGTAIASVGLLSVAGIIITADSFGPVSDNANGVVEMAELPEDVRNVTDVLDSIGNTTKATTKGYAIASAALAALVLFIALIFEVVRAINALGYSIGLGDILKSISAANPNVLVGAFIGAIVVYLFSSRTLGAVGVTAMEIVNEIRRQFRERPGILEWKEEPDYARVVDIATRRALGEFVVPGLVAIVIPLVTGIVLGWQALVGLILGAIIAGVPRALLMANAGGAWDNAKKYIELGHFGGKKSDAHKAAVVGDTVGDPFKDTTGPSLNPLIKVLNTLSVVFAFIIVYLNNHMGIVMTGLLPFIL